MSGRPRKTQRSAAPAPDLRITELIGLTEDGRMVLWSTGMVQPVDRFETSHGGCWIESGHYVIDWHGHAITVHCGNFADGSVSVQFMCGALRSVSMLRADVEKLLLGKVIPDPVAAAEISKKLQEMDAIFKAMKDTPERQRGKIA